jgi:major membrane immunogen (membrane-anchored lipoprotein)
MTSKKKFEKNQKNFGNFFEIFFQQQKIIVCTLKYTQKNGNSQLVPNRTQN